MPDFWSKNEVRATVEDYFEMLRLELAGLNYNKSMYRRALKQRLRDRSDRSVESKHQNISAVLIEMGIPYINGYKPLYNYQRTLLPQVISEYLVNHQDLHELLTQDSEIVPEIHTPEDILAIIEQPPTIGASKANAESGQSFVYNPTGHNYLEREGCNKALGDAGEELIINFERARLVQAGKENLADRIEQISVSRGPSAGFDILSFEVSGKDRYIEGKTTKYGKNTPFFVTANEFRFSEMHSAKYYLYRVFEFKGRPRMYILQLMSGHFL